MSRKLAPWQKGLGEFVERYKMVQELFRDASSSWRRRVGGVVRKQRVWAGKRFKMMLVVQDKFTLL